jgi:hypothetical protein
MGDDSGAARRSCTSGLGGGLGSGGSGVNTTIASLSPKLLRDLASAIEYRSPQAKARRDLTPEGVDTLADILLSGSRPTVGFFLRYREPA